MGTWRDYPAPDRIHYVRMSTKVPNISLLRSNCSHHHCSPQIGECYVRLIAPLPLLGRHSLRQFVQTDS